MFSELAFKTDQLGGVAGDLRDMFTCLFDLGRSVYSDHAAWAVLGREAHDHARLGRPGDSADDDRVEEHPQLGLLRGDLAGPAREPETPEPVIRRTSGNRVGDSAFGPDVFECHLPAVFDADPELRVD